MEDVGEFVATLAREGVLLEADGERLRYKAAPGALHPRSLSALRERKQEILAYLQNSVSPGHPDGGKWLPLSYAQEALVKAYERMSELSTQHLCVARRLVGSVDVPKIEAAVNALVVRHPALRTRYGRDPAGQWRAEIVDSWKVPVATNDFSKVPGPARDEGVRHWISELRHERFGLDTGPLLRAGVARLTDDEHVLALILHHSIVDFWSCNVLIRDLLMTYTALVRGEEPRLPPLLTDFCDHVRSVREFVHSDSGRGQLNYWRSLLSGVEDPFALPADRPPPLSGLPGGAEHLRIDGPGVARLKKLAQERKTTLQTIVLSAYVASLQAWSGTRTVLVAVAHFGRHTRELWDLVGCFIQCWVLRADVSAAMSFPDLIDHVADRWAQAQRHVHYPFAPLKSELARQSREHPLLHITFNYRPPGNATTAAGELQTSPFELGSQPEILDEGRGEKLNLTVLEFEDRIEGMVRYSPARFHRATIQAFLARLQSLLQEPERNAGFAEPLLQSITPSS
jgi:condensation domain-containing protein/tubulysin polyketide synthase-like protein